MNETKPSNPTLHAEGLKKRFRNPLDVTILTGVDLIVQPGESVAIMGRSGEGKTTLLHILGTLEHATEGSLKICGQQVNRFNVTALRRKHLGFIFQSYHLLDDYSVIDNVLMPAAINRENIKPGNRAYARALELLETVKLSHRAHFSTKLLSGGEKQRAAIARALFNDPDLILADEPSGNLDEETSKIIHDLMLNFSREQGKSLIVVTHNDKLAELCDKTYHLHNGALVPSNVHVGS
jgi:lipoprotein-releasing system ATP-binding protein